MELLYTSLLLLTFILLLSLIKLTGFSNRPKTQKLPPGPWQLPVIGSLHHLVGSGLPHRRFRDLARIHGPIMHLKLGEVSNVIISSPEAAREIMKTHDVNFATRPLISVPKVISYGGKSLIYAPYGEFWRQLRKVCVVELLSTRRVQSFQSIRHEEALALVRSISAASSSPVVNLTRTINSIANDITMRAVMGSKCGDQSAFLSALNEAVEAAGGFNLADLFPSSTFVSLFTGFGARLERIHQKLDGILDGIIREHEERRAAGKPADDLLDALLRLQESGDPDVPLTGDSLKAVVLDIFGAGSETAATTLTWAMTELARNSTVMKRLQLEIRGALEENQGRILTEEDTDKLSYLKLIIKETLRLHLPVPLLIPRECQSTCNVLGYDIPAKARVMVNAWAIARDPQYWGSDSEEFRPERFEGSEIDYKGANFEFIPFGSGRRICPGISFGVANVEHTLALLICYFDWKLPAGVRPSDLDMSESFGATARKKSDLYLTAIPSIPCPVV